MSSRHSFSLAVVFLVFLLTLTTASPVVSRSVRGAESSGCELSETFHGLDHAVIHWEATACSDITYDQARLVITRGSETFTTGWIPKESAIGDVTYSWAGTAVGETATARMQVRQGTNDPSDVSSISLTVDGSIWGVVGGSETVSASQLPSGAEYISVGSVTVLAGGSLSLGAGNYVGSGSISVYGTVSIDPAADLWYAWGLPVAIDLYAPHQFGAIDHAVIHLKPGSGGSQFASSTRLYVSVDPGSGTTTFNGVMTTTVTVESGGLNVIGGSNNAIIIGGDDDAEINGGEGSIIHNQGDYRGHLTVSDFEGDIKFDGSIFGGRGLVGGTAQLENISAPNEINVMVSDGGQVSLRDSEAGSVSLICLGTPVGNAEVTNNQIRGGLTLNGGSPQVQGNHVGGDIYLVGETGGSISGNRVLGGVLFSNQGATRWGSTGLKPTISGNSLLGSTALSSDFVMTTTIPIGPNYYGDAEGPRIFYQDNSGSEAVFLGRRGGKAVIGLDSSSPPWFVLETPLTSGIKWSDTQMCPKFWLQGMRIGQHILEDTSQGNNLTLGKPILATFDIVSSYPVAGVRVYAEIDGEKVAEQTLRLYRDLQEAGKSKVRGAFTTANLILPPRYQMPDTLPRLDVFIDTSGLPCNVGKPYWDDQHIYGGSLSFEPPMDRPVRIGVVPVKLFGFINGTGDAAAVRTAIKSLFPDMFPVRRTDVEVDVLPTISQFTGLADWGSATVLAFDLVARMTAGGAIQKATETLMGAPSHDFVVVALPKNAFGEGIDGAVYLNTRYPLVDSSRADVVVHEIGHGIGLWRSPEQYKQYPPDGLPVTDLTAFAATGKTSLPGYNGRVTHFPGVSHWAYLSAGFTDVMGSARSMWPIPSTYQTFKTWLRGLGGKQKDGLPAATKQPSTPVAEAVSSYVLIFGVTKADAEHPGYFKLVPDTIGAMDLSGIANPGSQSGGYGPCTWYYLIFYDGAGNMTTNNSFCVNGSSEEPGEYGVFAMWVWLPNPDPRKARMVIREGDYYTGPIVYDSQRANTVDGTLLSPTSGSTLGNTVTFQWQPASKKLWRVISYSLDGGATWRLMSAPQQTDSLTLSTDFLPAGQHISFRVWSADEFSFSEQRVNNLVVPNRPPQVTLIEPVSGTVAVPGTGWHLQVQASDLDDGELDGGTWTSSVDGVLGTGTSLFDVVLSPGQHTLTYTVTDSAGSSASVSSTVTVEEISSVDLSVGEDDLIVQPAGRPASASSPIYLTPELTHTLQTLFTNPAGITLTTTLTLTVTPPGGPAEVLMQETLPLMPFEGVIHGVEYIPHTEGTYTFEMAVTSSTLADPNLLNNRRTWQYSTEPEPLDAPQMPDIRVDRAGIEMITYVGGQPGDILTIENTGTAPLTWSLAETPAVSWLNESATSGSIEEGGHRDITISTNTAILNSGYYTTTLRLSHNSERINPIDISVTLRVAGTCKEITGLNIAFAPMLPSGGESVHFQGYVGSGSLPVTYNWDFGDGSAGDTGEHVFHTFPVLSHPQMYLVTVTASNGCSSGVSATQVVLVDAMELYLPLILRR